MAIGQLQLTPWAAPTAINPLHEAISSALQTAYQAAQTQKESAQANLPFGGASVRGPAGAIVGLEMVRQRYGDDSPQYQAAKNAFDLSQSSIGSRVNYQNALANSMGIRYTTPQGRQIIEQSNVAQGFSPAGTPAGQVISPGQAPYNPQAAMGDTGESDNNPVLQSYNLRQIKQNVPQQTLQKNLYASNIEKTLKNIDLDALTQYNNPLGQADLRREQGLDAIGESSPEYKKYKANLVQLNLLSSQVRQFYGDSIQPAETERRLGMLDPTGMFKSPETGKATFNAMTGILKKEMQTYRDAAKNTSIYRSSENSGPASVSPMKPDMEGAVDYTPNPPPPDTQWMLNPKTNMAVAVHMANIAAAKAPPYNFKELY